jgi:hypothetical protein
MVVVQPQYIEKKTQVSTTLGFHEDISGQDLARFHSVEEQRQWFPDVQRS